MNFFSKLKKKVFSLPNIYQNHGLDGVYFSLLRNLGFKSKYLSILDKKKEKLEKEIINYTKKFIINGPYQNTLLNCKSNWSGNDWSSKLLGIYEEQVQNKIIEVQKKFSLENIVNFGASDGYHLIGLIKNKIFQKGIGFEIDQVSREYLIDNIKKNNLENNINVESEANFKKVEQYLSSDQLIKTIFLIDIEGEEFNLINNHNLNYYKNSLLLIENHEFLVNDNKKVEQFFNLLNENFEIEKIENSSRNPYQFSFMDKVSDDERWLLMSEGREQNMNWLLCTPKDRTELFDKTNI